MAAFQTPERYNILVNFPTFFSECGVKGISYVKGKPELFETNFCMKEISTYKTSSENKCFVKLHMNGEIFEENAEKEKDLERLLQAKKS